MSATAMETNLARQGSNFGLPIALHLAVLMRGGIGIVEVGPRGLRPCMACPSLMRHSHAAVSWNHLWLYCLSKTPTNYMPNMPGTSEHGAYGPARP
jgi:hypothetical protein